MRTKVVVAISGGADSAISAYLLKQEGFDVIGLHITIADYNWCCSRKSAMLVAEALGIEFITVDKRAEFNDKVIRPFLHEYKSGMTPNPCILCNPEIKWKTLVEVADRVGAEFVATGHYARACEMPWGWSLMKSADKSKDQSYFLYNIPTDMLIRTRFPLASLTKEFVRQKVRDMKIPAIAEESQEICFIPKNGLQDFLKENIPEACKPGNVYNTSGEEVGRHRGVAFYTVGQREKLGGGFKTPMYVARILPEKNALIIGKWNEILSSRITVRELFLRRFLGRTFDCKVKIRYRSSECPARVTILNDETASVEFSEPQRAPAPGQSAVFYFGIEVIGGGIISGVEYNWHI